MSSGRVEADERLDLAADVQDAETHLDQLTYEWTADKDSGQFVGTGRQVNWQAPHLKPTPDTYVLTLTVIERYQSGAETKENRVSSSVTVRYNDSYREVRDLATTFLGDFSNFSVSPEACVRNFTDSCPGKFDELSQIRDNRRLFRILSGTFSVNSITLNGDKTFGITIVPCQFVSTVVASGKTETATGRCTLTAVYEPDKSKWFLCDSFFDGSSTLTLKGLDAMVP